MMSARIYWRESTIARARQDEDSRLTISRKISVRILRQVPGALRLALLALAADSASHSPDTDLAVAIIQLG
jgi:hypothetical protein